MIHFFFFFQNWPCKVTCVRCNHQVVAGACFVRLPSCLLISHRLTVLRPFYMPQRLQKHQKVDSRACHRDQVNARCLHSLNSIKSSAIRARVLASRQSGHEIFKSPARVVYSQISDFSPSRKRRRKCGCSFYLHPTTFKCELYLSGMTTR